MCCTLPQEQTERAAPAPAPAERAPPAPKQYIKGTIKQVLDGGAVVIRGAPRGGPPPGGSRKSAADRRLEALEIVKNPYDPSLKQTDAAASSSRLNMDTAAIPGSNPPAPDPAGAKQTNAPSGGPDYAALLQYLQYYQKQVGGPEDTAK